MELHKDSDEEDMGLIYDTIRNDNDVEKVKSTQGIIFNDPEDTIEQKLKNEYKLTNNPFLSYGIGV